MRSRPLARRRPLGVTDPPPRSPQHGWHQWARALAVWMVMTSAVSGLAGCRATNFLNDVGKEHLDLGRMEADIRSGLQRRLESGSRSTSASVTSVSRVRCRERSELAATCVARVVERDGRRRVRIEVTVNPETGDYTWEVVS